MAIEELTGLDLPEVVLAISGGTVGSVASNLSNFWAVARARENSSASYGW